MSEPAIEPADVYQRVNELYSAVIWLARLIGLLCVLVVIQLIAKRVIFGKVIKLLEENREMMRINKGHNKVNDSQAARVEASILQTAADLKTELPPAVVEEIERKAGDSSAILKRGGSR